MCSMFAILNCARSRNRVARVFLFILTGFFLCFAKAQTHSLRLMERPPSLRRLAFHYFFHDLLRAAFIIR